MASLSRKLTSKIYEIRAHTGKVTCLDLGETGRVLVTGGQDRNVNLWAIGEEKCFMSLTGHNGTIDCVKFAYNDDFVYSADEIGIIRRWDLNAQTISSTLNGHMKSVRTLDFNPSGEYVVSGSNDTTVRLWDVRNQNKCIKNYRGHVANVNSVKFSPDGLWIASAGSEGSIIIWDIRQSKQIIQFVERTSPVTCIQYHPYEFLLAAGRNDGSIFIYDLETNQLISKIENLNKGSNNITTHSASSIKCVTFSENGECLFVGSPECISVIGWEPDREFDHIESTWNVLDDMKIVNRKLICGSHDKEFVSIHALSVDRLHPFYNPSNAPFSHNQSSRKSFSRGNQKLRLSISPTKQSVVQEENEDISPLSVDGGGGGGGSGGGLSSPNLSIEMVDENDDQPASTQSSLSYDGYIPDTKKTIDPFNNFSAFSHHHHNVQNIPLPSPSVSSSSSSPHSYLKSNGGGFEGPSSLKMPGELDMYHHHRFNKTVSNNTTTNYSNDISFGLNDSNPPILANYEEADLEDFPVNNATPPDYAPKMDLMSSKPLIKQKSALTSTQVQKNKQQITSSNRIGSSGGGIGYQKKLSGMSSISTMELHKVDDSILPQNNNNSNNRKQTTNSNISKFRRPELNTNNKENNIKNNRNITVQIITKPPSRSKTSFDLRNQSNHVQTAPTKITSYTTDDTSEIHMLASYHDQVYQELSNRHATLQMIRNSTRSQDVVGALKQAIKINGRSVFVDILGAILERTSTWNLDLCLLLLPEIYELLQSKHKFHYTRACDALRVILSNFLPIIQENIDPWSPARCIGVDITREERQRKCIECQQWLLRVRNLPDVQHIGSTLTQLQNMIVDI